MLRKAALAALLVATWAGFAIEAVAQGGLARQQSGPPLLTTIGLTLTVVSMMILLLVFLAINLSKAAAPTESTPNAAPAATPETTMPPAAATPTVTTPDAHASPATTVLESDAESSDMATVTCQRCGKTVVDFKALRRDPLSCPGCGEELRPAP